MLTGNIDACYPDVDADLCIRSICPVLAFMNINVLQCIL